MAIIESLYPYALAGINMISGWLLYELLGTNLGVILLAVGVILILAVAFESSRAYMERTSA
jgi:hypothetical protein